MLQEKVNRILYVEDESRRHRTMQEWKEKHCPKATIVFAASKTELDERLAKETQEFQIILLDSMLAGAEVMAPSYFCQFREKQAFSQAIIIATTNMSNPGKPFIQGSIDPDHIESDLAGLIEELLNKEKDKKSDIEKLLRFCDATAMLQAFKDLFYDAILYPLQAAALRSEGLLKEPTSVPLSRLPDMQQACSQGIEALKAFQTEYLKQEGQGSDVEWHFPLLAKERNDHFSGFLKDAKREYLEVFNNFDFTSEEDRQEFRDSLAGFYKKFVGVQKELERELRPSELL